MHAQHLFCFESVHQHTHTHTTHTTLTHSDDSLHILIAYIHNTCIQYTLFRYDIDVRLNVLNEVVCRS